MIPMRTSTVFKSRWMALLWAAGVIWLAVDVAGSATPPATAPATNGADASDSTGAAATNEDVEAAARALGLD